MHSRRNFLRIGLALGAGCITTRGFANDAVALAASRLQAGTGRSEVVFPPFLYPFDGFTGEHDPLAVRVLLLDDGDTRIGIVVVDLTSISDGMITVMKATLAELAGVEPIHAIVCAGHSFSTPHVFVGGSTLPDTDSVRNKAMQDAFEGAMRTAAMKAVTSLVPARLGYGAGASRVGVNRDVPTPHGWWLGANDAGFVDPCVGVLRVNDSDGKPLAILMNVAVQPSVMDGSQLTTGGKLISADLAGMAVKQVEAYFPGTVAMFIVGAAGDQSPYLQANRHVVDADGGVARVDLHETGFALLDLLGERLGADVVSVADNILMQSRTALSVTRELIAVPGLDFSPRNAPVHPTTSFSYRTAGNVDVPVVIICMGDIAFVGMAPELAASVGTWIRSASPFVHTMVATMVDGAAKYLPDAQSYDRFTYEARSSPYAQGAAESVARAIVRKLHQIKKG